MLGRSPVRDRPETPCLVASLLALRSGRIDLASLGGATCMQHILYFVFHFFGDVLASSNSSVSWVWGPGCPNIIQKGGGAEPPTFLDRSPPHLSAWFWGPHGPPRPQEATTPCRGRVPEGSLAGFYALQGAALGVACGADFPRTSTCGAGPGDLGGPGGSGPGPGIGSCRRRKLISVVCYEFWNGLKLTWS